MDWSDESYVKLYTRDTVTWLSWPWQARAVFPLLMRKLDGAGLMASGRLELTRAVAVMIGIPEEVVAPAVDALLADGTIEKVAGGLLVTKFLEAQEARKNDRLRAAEYRGRTRDNAKSAKPQHPPVTRRHETSQPVTLLPCPAPPSPTKTPAAKKPAAGADPRLQPLVEELEADYAAIREGARYKHGGAKDTQALKSLLTLASDEEIRGRWCHGLRAPRTDWASCSTFAQLGAKWNDLAAPMPEPPRSRFERFDPNEGIIRSGGPLDRGHP